jgi:hypothetical protein
MGAPVSRPPGFDVMDVDTSIANEPKFKRIARTRPEHVAPAFMVYVALLGESWKSAERATVGDAWPILLPFDEAVVESMKAASLIDKSGRVPATAWKKRFTEANQRRKIARDRWNRYNANRAKPADARTNDDADTTQSPRGTNADTASSVPTVPLLPFRAAPTVPTEETKEIPPPPAERGRRSNGTNPRATGTTPRRKATNPRANGASARQVRADQKRGPTHLGEVLRKAAATTDDHAEPAWSDDVKDVFQ